MHQKFVNVYLLCFSFDKGTQKETLWRMTASVAIHSYCNFLFLFLFFWIK